MKRNMLRIKRHILSVTGKPLLLDYRFVIRRGTFGVIVCMTSDAGREAAEAFAYPYDPVQTLRFLRRLAVYAVTPCTLCEICDDLQKMRKDMLTKKK